MNTFKMFSMGAALALAAGLSLPAAAQMTYNFSDTGNCNFPPATCTVTGSATVANNLTISAWSAASASNFVAATITDQSSSGVGMRAPGESTGSPQHAIDNDGSHELMLLNFGTNRVVLTGLASGWSQNDTDVVVLRWTGATGPDLTTTQLTGTAGLVAKGWTIMSSADMDGGNTTGQTFGALSTGTGLAATAANSSSWWIVSAYFGGGSLGAADAAMDYFKLLSVSATCVGNTAGGACNATPPGRVSEPGTLALAGFALAGFAFSLRKRKL